MAKKSKTQRAKASAARQARKAQAAELEAKAKAEAEAQAKAAAEEPEKKKGLFKRSGSKKEEIKKEEPKKTEKKSEKKAEKKPKKQHFKFLREVRSELKRVTWPSRQEVIRWSIVVIVALLFFGIFVAILDNLIIVPLMVLISGLGA